MPKSLLWYLLITNLITLVVFAVDKKRAKRGQWRIKESTLLFWCLIGGSIGGLAGMYLLRHKTRHPKFSIGIPGIITLQLIGAFIVIKYLV
ncbi:MAG: DUF1294 domain-containing protein [Methylocystaceae bacterium]